jgi:hypothetical protein
MIERRITKIKKNKEGDIVALCNSEAYWSPRNLEKVIEDIEIRKVSYIVHWEDDTITKIELVNGPSGKYLRTKRQKSPRNDLFELPIA